MQFRRGQVNNFGGTIYFAVDGTYTWGGPLDRDFPELFLFFFINENVLMVAINEFILHLGNILLTYQHYLIFLLTIK